MGTMSEVKDNHCQGEKRKPTSEESLSLSTTPYGGVSYKIPFLFRKISAFMQTYICVLVIVLQFN